MTPITIYLLDNSTLSRFSNEIYLSANEYAFIRAFANVNECILAIDKAIPDIIIADIDMPGTSGINEIKLIRKKYPQIKIIIYTSRDDKESILASLSSGFCAYSLKNNGKKLKTIISKVLKNEFYMDLKMAQHTFSKISAQNGGNIELTKEGERLKTSLTEREIEVLRLLTAGKTNTQIAKAIVISANTAKAHIGSIFTKLAVKDRVQAAVKAVKANIL